MTAERMMLSPKEAADRLSRDGYGIKLYTLKQWIYNGDIPSVHAGRNTLVYYPNVVAFLTGKEVRS